MGRELRPNWLWSYIWGLLGTLGKSLPLLVPLIGSPITRGDYLGPHSVALKGHQIKKVNCEELPEELPG